MTCSKLWFCLLIGLIFSSCYSFKGTSISTGVESFYVANFRNNAFNAPAEIGLLFSDKLRDKVRRESRLAYADRNSSIEFEGSVTGYSVTSVAPQNIQETGLVGSSLNRLQITVQVDFINNIDEKEGWQQQFNFFQDFDSSQNLADLQNELIEVIFEQITEDIFNRAFSDW